jgi:hypothetical protein
MRSIVTFVARPTWLELEQETKRRHLTIRLSISMHWVSRILLKENGTKVWLLPLYGCVDESIPSLADFAQNFQGLNNP